MKISIGPAIEQGFYYDFEFPDGVSVSEADFPAIEDRMRAHVKAAERFEREDIPVADARARFAALGQDYKVELIDDLVRAQPSGATTVTSRSTPTAPSPTSAAARTRRRTKTVGSFQAAIGRRRLLAGGLHTHDAHPHLWHRVLHKGRARGAPGAPRAGPRSRSPQLERELDLFQFSELSPGAPLWKPAGVVVWNTLAELWREENRARGYEEVKTPILYDVELFKQSGTGTSSGSTCTSPRSKPARWA